jgi:hypothetical protein
MRHKIRVGTMLIEDGTKTPESLRMETAYQQPTGVANKSLAIGEATHQAWENEGGSLS